MNATAAAYFQKFLWDDPLGAQARDYLSQRDISREVADQFGIGLAPREIGLLRNYMATLGFDETRLAAAGLLVQGEDGSEPRPLISADQRGEKEDAMTQFFACIRENRLPVADIKVAATAALTAKNQQLEEARRTADAAKSGADEGELPAIIEALDSASHLEFRGLMTLPPFFDSPEQTRPYFRRLREILDGLNRGRALEQRLTELSMGMSHDFEAAIEEGATMVRVGTAIFGTRETQ